MIAKRTYIFLYILLAIVIGFGLWMPLMENDSAQHATMAMQMAKNNQFFEIYKGETPYLDKPHMHFWLSALSFKIFGFHVWVYRLPAILLTVLGAYGISKISLLLFHQKNIGKLATLIFLSSFAIILSLHDVRTDAVLVAFTILACWQWLRFLIKSSLFGAILGGLFAAFAYSTKGIFAVAVIGLFLLYVVLFQNLWKRLLSYKLLVGVLFFLIGSLPMFYAYYHQFGWEGIEFITYGQSTGRFKGEDFGTASENDYFFFFHTILWAMLPWGLWFYYSLVYQAKNSFQKKFKPIPNLKTAWIPAATVFTFIIGMNFSSFKLPHYLNIVLPFAALLTAFGYHNASHQRSKTWYKLYSYTQYFTVFIGVMLFGVLVYCFPIKNWWLIVLLMFFLVGLIYLYIHSSKFEKPILLAAGFILTASIYLNSTFYPTLLQYQANHSIGDYIIEHDIPKDDIYSLNKPNVWATDWKIQKTIPKKSVEEIENLSSPFYAIIYKDEPTTLIGENYHTEILLKAKHYRITRLKWKFLNPKTRKKTLDNAYLVKVVRKK